MKLSKSYSLKKSKSDEIISFTFPIIDICNRKMTPDVASRRLPDSASPQLLYSVSRGVDDSPIWRVSEYDNFGLFLRPSIIALYKKSLLYF